MTAPHTQASDAGRVPPGPRHDVWRWVVRTCAAVGALVAAWACYGFGTQVSGVLLGVVAAINGGLFGALIAGTLVDSLVNRWAHAAKKPVR